MMKRTFTKFFVMWCAVCLFTTGAMAQIIYVDASKTSGANNGTSWADAYTDLELALAEAENPLASKEIWVAKGIYYPSKRVNPSGSERHASFDLPDDVKLYGGFKGDGTDDINTRDFVANETILSGDVGTLGNDSDNSYHVVVIVNRTGTITMDGFTVQDGRAVIAASTTATLRGVTLAVFYGGGFFIDDANTVFKNLVVKNNKAARTNNNTGVFTYGGGMFVRGGTDKSITMENAVFENNEVYNAGTANDPSVYGGAIYLGGGDAITADFKNVTFTDNHAHFTQSTSTSSYGGAIAFGSTPVTASFTNLIFANNSAHRGGAIYLRTYESTMTVANSLFYNNEAKGDVGGGLYIVNGIASLINSTLYANKATGAAANGGGLHVFNGATLNVHNSIILGNTATISGNDMYVATNVAQASTINITNSITQGHVGGTTGTDPFISENVNTTAIAADVFINPSLTDYTNADFLRLNPVEGNPAINTGDDTKYDVALYGTNDLGGADRFNGTVDLGPYENHTTLPVELSAPLSAKVNGSAVVLSWATATETNNSHFLLQRSSDGGNFTQIANVPSKGNGAHYSHTDFSPANGTNYYRLVQIDNDGKETVYSPVSVNISLNAQNGASVYPNPVSGTEANVSLGDAAASSYGYKVVSTAGSVVQQGTVRYNGTSATISVGSLPAGVYVLHFSNGAQAKLVKQ